MTEEEKDKGKDKPVPYLLDVNGTVYLFEVNRDRLQWVQDNVADPKRYFLKLLEHEAKRCELEAIEQELNGMYKR